MATHLDMFKLPYADTQMRRSKSNVNSSELDQPENHSILASHLMQVICGGFSHRAACFRIKLVDRQAKGHLGSESSRD